MVKTLPSNAGGAGSIPGQGAKIPHASGPKKKPKNIKQKQYCNKFNEDFKIGPHQKKNLVYIFRFMWERAYKHILCMLEMAL